MNVEKIEIYLARIADALEKISEKIDNENTTSVIETINNIEGTVIETENISNIFIKDNSELIRFLNSKNINVKVVKPEDEADDIMDNIALFMGNRYSKIKKIYDLIKRHMNSGRSFRIDLKNLQQDEVSSITQLCSNLYQIAFLEEYRYYKSPKFLLFGKVNRIPRAQNFFSGGWLERYIKTAIIKTIEKHQVSYSYLKNPQIVLPNGDDFELDILFKIENEIYWIEAKTGEYQRYVQKYSNMSQILNLDYEHSFMVLTDINVGAANALKSIFKMTVYRIDEFSEEFKKRISHILNDDNLKEDITTQQQ